MPVVSEDFELDRRKLGTSAGGDDSCFEIGSIGNEELKVGTLLRAAGKEPLAIVLSLPKG